MTRMPENRTHRFIRYWLPVIVYCAAIFVQSCFPSPRAVPSIWNLDKAVHFVAYGVLGVLFYRALKSAQTARREGLTLFLAI
ncbi:MAG: hypothetical protein JRI36_08975, partial [Deltaproteobacteria bacterium]|nr:hypothetical protein [Deltaproteobacteria bacterium]